MAMRTVAAALLAAALGGCSGEYILTIPDQVAPAGGRAAAVVRLQQYEFGPLRRIIEDAPMRMSVDGLAEMGAFTDELGFAGASVPVPDKPGRYELLVQMQNSNGDEVSGKAPVYVWAKDQPIVAVDTESLPMSDPSEIAVAREALSKISSSSSSSSSSGARILYLTRRRAEDVHIVRDALRTAGLPDGPVLVWLRSCRHLARTGRLRMPRIINEAYLACDLSLMRKVFSGLRTGISASRVAAQAFEAAGMSGVFVGGSSIVHASNARRTSWSDLAADGLTP